MLIYICVYFIVMYKAVDVNGNISIPAEAKDVEIFKIISDVVSTNYEDNGWPAILFYGPVPDEFYYQIDHLQFTYLHVDSAYELPPTGDIGYPYLLHTVVINCFNLRDFGAAMLLITKMHFWNPEATMIVNIKEADDLSVAHIFYEFWWYQSIHVLIIQNVEKSNLVHIYNYNPYTHSGYRLQTSAECWSGNRWTPVYYTDILTSARCRLGCGDIPNSTKPRRRHLVTCLSFNKKTKNIYRVGRESRYIEDQTANLQGYPLKGFGGQVPPFLLVKFFENGSYVLDSRDGILWNTMSERMNFTIQLVHLDNYAKPFSYIMNTKMVFDMSYRVIDFLLCPMYQVDLIVSVVRLLFPIRESGVCVVAHRADFVASWFDTANLNYTMLAMFTVCIVTVWSVFALFKYVENGKLTFDQLGKDFNNTIRNILMIALYKPPRKRTFRIYLAVSLWSFFLVNFALQASIMSFLTVLKRGKEVDTLEDVVERRYPVHGFWSPDMILPENEPVYQKFNQLKVHIQGMYECVDELEHNPRLCCLMDCTMAKYFMFNKLNWRGEPYLHVLRDKIHSRFLHMALPHQSPLARRMNKYMMGLTEGGLISKFEGYRYNKIHEEAPSVKSFSLSDLSGVFRIFVAAQVLNVIVFLCELVVGNRSWIRNIFKNTERLLRLKFKKKHKPREVSTQTEP